MPCRKENYIFLEQSVTVDSKEVDALVTKIGEALQLHNNSGHQNAVSVSVSCLHAGVKQQPAAAAAAAAPAQRRSGCCVRLRGNRAGHRGSSRASPYSIPGSNGEQDWDQIRPWHKKRLGVEAAEEDDDPHRMLQELILSGNLIKEAVRRLQFSAADCADFPNAAADNVPC
ncbi:glycogen synthase kinase binding protein [Scophthalmus maximus]|nr:glycogen synthase kinase binding protein [Scophthalmus maximus]